MLKPVVKPVLMIVSAAAIAAVATFGSFGASAGVSAGPLPASQASAMKTCADRPWPYLNCVGTPFGNPRIRLVTTDHLSN